MARPFQHEHQRHAFLRSQLHKPVALVRAGIADRAGKHREVLDARKRRAAIDPAKTCHQPVGGRGGAAALAHIAGEGANFDKAVRVEKRCRAGAGVQLAGIAVALESFIAAHRMTEIAAALQFPENRRPRVTSCCHHILPIPHPIADLGAA